MTPSAMMIVGLVAMASLSMCAAAELPPEVEAAMKAVGVNLKVAERPPFPKPTAQSVEVTLTPLTWRTGDIVASFGLPFPPGVMPDDSRISVEDAAGQEVPLFTKPLVKWWIDRKEGTIRSVLVQFEVRLPDRSKTPQKFLVRWDKARTKNRPEEVPVDRTQDVVPVSPGFPPEKPGLAAYLTIPATQPSPAATQPPTATQPTTRRRRRRRPAYEPVATFFDFRQPKILATLPPQWLCDSLLVWQQLPAAENKVAPWFDEHFDRHFPGSLKWIAVGRNGSPSYLFDRAATYTKAYVRTGKAEHLLAALQVADYYTQHISFSGLFVYAGDDLKYVLTEGPALAYMLTGDERYPAVIAQMTKAWERHTDIEYTDPTMFWTERHTGFGLMAYLHSYEVTGNMAHLDKAKQFFEAALAMQAKPGDGKETVGAWLHTGRSHGDGNGWTTSPWMSAFLTDAIWKYWMNSGDPRAPASLLMYAKYAQRYCITPDGTSTWYMANAPGRGTSVGRGRRNTGVPQGEVHNMEVAYLMAMGHYLSGGADKDYLPKIQMLYPPMLVADSANKPGRKFNWRFREASMMLWFLANTP